MDNFPNGVIIWRFKGLEKLPVPKTDLDVPRVRVVSATPKFTWFSPVSTNKCIYASLSHSGLKSNVIHKIYQKHVIIRNHM